MLMHMLPCWSYVDAYVALLKLCWCVCCVAEVMLMHMLPCWSYVDAYVALLNRSVDAYVALLNRSVLFHPHHMAVTQQQLAHCYHLVPLQEPQYMGFMPENRLHHNICVLCPVKWNLMHLLKVEISSNDIWFNVNYIIVFMYGTSPEPVCTGKLP